LAFFFLALPLGCFSLKSFPLLGVLLVLDCIGLLLLALSLKLALKFPVRFFESPHPGGPFTLCFAELSILDPSLGKQCSFSLP